MRQSFAQWRKGRVGRREAGGYGPHVESVRENFGSTCREIRREKLACRRILFRTSDGARYKFRLFTPIFSFSRAKISPRQVDGSLVLIINTQLGLHCV